MFKRPLDPNFVLGIAVGFYLLIIPVLYWAGSHNHDKKGHDNANRSSLSQQKSYPEEIYGSRKPKSIGDLNSRSHPDSKHFYNHQGLQAQTSMAESTNAIENYTYKAWVSSLALGILGILGITWTLYETRRTVSVTREIGRAQTRAYLSFDIGDISIEKMLIENIHKMKIVFAGKFVNSGQTPAKFVQMYYNIETVKVGDIVQISPDGSDLYAAGQSAAFIASGGNNNHTAAKYIAYDPNSSGENVRIRFTYLIKYLDVFDQEISTSITSGSVQEHPNNPDGIIFVPDTMTDQQGNRSSY